MSAPVLTLGRRLLTSVCLLLILTTPALASPDAVILDYGDNGRVDARHSLADLRAALDIWQENPQYGAFADEVTAAIDRRLLGVVADTAAPDDSAPAPRAEDPPRAEPAPPAVPRPEVDDPAPARAGQVGDLEGEIVAASPLDTLPSPPVASADPGRPLALIVFAGIALALVLAGLGTAAHRRLRP